MRYLLDRCPLCRGDIAHESQCWAWRVQMRFWWLEDRPAVVAALLAWCVLFLWLPAVAIVVAVLGGFVAVGAWLLAKLEGL